MASKLSNVGLLRISTAVRKIGLRSCATVSPSEFTPLSPAEQAFRDKNVPRIGNRDIVGFGRNGNYTYADSQTYPYPAIRWQQNTARTDALMKKAQGDWKQLTLEEKKELYRHSFCQTYAEQNAPNSEWKIVWGIVLLCLSASCGIYMFLRNSVYDAMLPPTITREHQQASIARMVAQRHGVVEGYSSKWDYEKNEWKK